MKNYNHTKSNEILTLTNRKKSILLLRQIMINVPSSFAKWATIWQMLLWLRRVVLFFCFHRWVAGKGREKCISNGGCIITSTTMTTTMRMNTATAVASDEPRRLNIVYIRSSKSVRRRFLFLSSTRERVSAGAHTITLYPPSRRNMNERGMERSTELARSTFSVLIAQ